VPRGEHSCAEIDDQERDNQKDAEIETDLEAKNPTESHSTAERSRSDITVRGRRLASLFEPRREARLFGSTIGNWLHDVPP
jgi:hypothetical protein